MITEILARVGRRLLNIVLARDLDGWMTHSIYDVCFFRTGGLVFPVSLILF